MKLTSFLPMVALFVVCIGLWGCGMTYVPDAPPPEEYTFIRPIEGTDIATVEVYETYLSYKRGDHPLYVYYAKKDPKTGKYYHACETQPGV